VNNNIVKSKQNILIINTGGTFNKIYNELNGNLDVEKNNIFIEDILSKAKITDISIAGIIYKDSLDINNTDRIKLTNYIKKSQYDKILIVHGTDTMNISAKFLELNITNKQIVLTGAMIPYSIDGIEATANLLMGYGYLLANHKNGIFISMHGMVKKHTKIKKNKKLGVFQCL